MIFRTIMQCAEKFQNDGGIRQALLAESQRNNIYLIMDLVVNHCSDKHEWFQKALADRTR